MGLKPDRWIKDMARKHGMIEPFVDSQVRDGAISYGVSSYGYDMRVSDEFKIFTNVRSTIVDPKQFDTDSFVDFRGDECIIPPNSFVLARSVEYFRIPRKVLTICLGKSTYARCGLIVNVTPFEPEWEGFVTLEISNTTPLPAKVYANEGLAQVLFFEADEVCEQSLRRQEGQVPGTDGGDSAADVSDLCLDERGFKTLYCKLQWAISSIGRASGLHLEGCKFESYIAHTHQAPASAGVFRFPRRPT